MGSFLLVFKKISHWLLVPVHYYWWPRKLSKLVQAVLGDSNLDEISFLAPSNLAFPSQPIFPRIFGFFSNSSSSGFEPRAASDDCQPGSPLNGAARAKWSTSCRAFMEKSTGGVRRALVKSPAGIPSNQFQALVGILPFKEDSSTLPSETF